LAGKSGRRDVIANVIVEAMAAGLPVVVSHIPGVEELVEDGVSGYLVPPNCPEGFALAMKKLAASRDDRVRFGKAARLRVLRDLDGTKNVRLLAELFAAAAGNPETTTPGLPNTAPNINGRQSYLMRV
jgi:glycosyltransferase involved in cell wall biosynthesis